MSVSLEEIQRSLDLRANSLIVTVFGDTILPLGGGTWLSGLIALMADFGLSERLVRTGVYRLQKLGILQSRTEGRRAYYSLSDLGRATFETAEKRIYQLPDKSWNGEWQLIYLLPGLSGKERRRVKKELAWQSFGEIGPSLLARPSNQTLDQSFLVKEETLKQFILPFTSKLDSEFPDVALSSLVANSWELDQLQSDYEKFIARFTMQEHDLDGLLRKNASAPFVLRTLLIHDYRHLLLHDPQLPEDLLPKNWTGTHASELAASIYKETASNAQNYAIEKLSPNEASEVKINPDFYRRFDNLDSDRQN